MNSITNNEYINVMETRKIILLAILTMAVPMASHAQENIVKAFEKIEKSTTIHTS